MILGGTLLGGWGSGRGGWGLRDNLAIKIFLALDLKNQIGHFPARFPGDDDRSASCVGVDGRRVVADDGAARGRPRPLGQALLRRDR